MIECRGRFPASRVVTCSAVVLEFPLVGIGMARDACSRQPEVRTVRRFGKNLLYETVRDVRGSVALAAGDLRMLPDE